MMTADSIGYGICAARQGDHLSASTCLSLAAKIRNICLPLVDVQPAHPRGGIFQRKLSAGDFHLHVWAGELCSGAAAVLLCPQSQPSVN